MKLFLKKKYISNQRLGFTLIELITVVSVVGILTGIANISYRSWIAKVISAGCTSQISSYKKAAQAYFAKYSTLPALYDLEDEGLVSILACRYDQPKDCKNAAPVKATTRLIGGGGNWNTYWPSPSGHCKIQYRTYGYHVQLWATPHHNSPYTNWASTACFNSQTGVSTLNSFSYSVSTYKLHNNSFC